MITAIEGGTIVNEGKSQTGSIIIENERIVEITTGDKLPRGNYDRRVDATGSLVLPGVIDEHVHFREPGLTAKADMESESRAAAYGGVTSFLDMPNTLPQTTALDALKEKWALAEKKSHVNYGFFLGATNANSSIFAQADATRIPGIKLFMGASTGNMLVDRLGSLLDIFRECARLGLPLMTHCEDSEQMSATMKEMKKAYGDDPPIALHPLIRSDQACYDSSALAVNLARQFGTRLHIAHLSTARELELLMPWHEGEDLPQITGEAALAHLSFSSEDYLTLGSRIKCNPAVKTAADRDALWKALSDGRIAAIGTDHAPHLLKDKEGGAAKAASGMPMVQFSLPVMLELCSQGVLSCERLVWLMCHNPARLFGIHHRGFLRKGYQADIVIVRQGSAYTVTDNMVQSKCGWTPLVGKQLHWRVTHTFCNGHPVLNDGQFDADYRGQALRFRMGEA